MRCIILRKSKEFVEMIIEYSQEYGLTDTEIAEALNCSRSTIARIKKEYNLPNRNVNNRRDKSYVCPFCKSTIFIKRCESITLMCENCKKSKNFIYDVIKDRL